MTTDLAKLRALAAKATPGPWKARPDKHDDWGTLRSSSGDFLAQVYAARYVSAEERDEHRRNKTDPYGDNLAYIAALDPQTVLALIASHEALQAEVERLRVALRNSENDNHDLDSTIRQLTTALSALIAEVKEVTGPFAELAALLFENEADDTLIWGRTRSAGEAAIRIKHVRRAAALHEKLEG